MPIERTAALVVDDHELFRSGLVALLRRVCGFRDVIEAKSLDEAVQILGERPDISMATFEIGLAGLENALNLISVREVMPDLCVVVVAGSRRREDMLMALTAGARGYVLKTASTAEITAAIEKILNGEIFVPAVIAELPRRSDGAPRALRDTTDSSNRALTQRQKEVLQLIRSGKSNKEIARALHLAESTVKVHTNAIYRTLGVHSRSSAAAIKPR